MLGGLQARLCHAFLVCHVLVVKFCYLKIVLGWTQVVIIVIVLPLHYDMSPQCMIMLKHDGYPD